MRLYIEGVLCYVDNGLYDQTDVKLLIKNILMNDEIYIIKECGGLIIINIKNELITQLICMHERMNFIITAFSIYVEILNNNDSSVIDEKRKLFNVITRSIEYALILELAKLFAIKGEAGSLYKIVNICYQNQTIFTPKNYSEKIPCRFDESYTYTFKLNNKGIDEIIMQANKLLDSNKDNMNIINEYRDKHFAHSDKAYFAKEYILSEKMPLNKKLYENLINCASIIINDVSKALNLYLNDYDSSVGQEVYKLIK